MGNLKKNRRHFFFPKFPWDKAVLTQEKELCQLYGLKRKKELYTIRHKLKKMRLYFKKELKEKNKELFLQKLYKFGLLHKEASFFSLTEEAFLKRQLQTLVFLKGFSKTIKEARQMINHKKIVCGTKIKRYPRELISLEEEQTLTTR